MVDEHYYEKPEWFVRNLARYDKYSRSNSKVYVGEYAAHDVKTQEYVAFSVGRSAVYDLAGTQWRCGIVCILMHLAGPQRAYPVESQPDLFYRLADLSYNKLLCASCSPTMKGIYITNVISAEVADTTKTFAASV